MRYSCFQVKKNILALLFFGQPSFMLGVEMHAQHRGSLRKFSMLITRYYPTTVVVIIIIIISFLGSTYLVVQV